MQTPIITVSIIAATTIVSLIAFGNENLHRKFIFNPYIIKRRKEFWRFFTSSLLHGDYMHLIFNMYALYMFGGAVEMEFYRHYEGNYGMVLLFYLLLYVPATALSCIYTYEKRKNDIYYNALGASGAVSAIVFAFIAMEPLEQFRVFFAIPIRAFLFGILFLVVSWILARRAKDNIGHDAHFFGAIYGLVFVFIIQPQRLGQFIQAIQIYIQNRF